MALEEDAPPRPRARLEKLVLDPLGIEELRDYIGELRARSPGWRRTSTASRAIAARRMPSFRHKPG